MLSSIFIMSILILFVLIGIFVSVYLQIITMLIKVYLSFSSISHSSWILMGGTFSFFNFIVYYLLYTLVIYLLVSLLIKLLILGQGLTSSSNIMFVFFFFTLSGIPPFIIFYVKWVVICSIFYSFIYYVYFLIYLNLVVGFYAYLRYFFYIFVFLFNGKLKSGYIIILFFFQIIPV